MEVEKKKEMREILDYPDYAVTKDGRVWSYINHKFLKSRDRKGWKNVVILRFDGMLFERSVGRLVFTTFYGYEPEIIIYKDGNPYNTSLENLEGMTRLEFNRRLFKGKKYRVSPRIFRVDPCTGEEEIIQVSKGDKDYDRIHKALNRSSLTSGGYLYYYEGEKEELIKEIQARLRCDELVLPQVYYQYRRTQIKKAIKDNKKYLEVLTKEKVLEHG